MIRAGDLHARSARMAARIRELGALLPDAPVRREQGVDPLGFGLSYPLIFMAYDVETGIETPLSGLIHEDDPNVVVVSLVAEAIAEEANISQPYVCSCGVVVFDPSDPGGPAAGPCSVGGFHAWRRVANPSTEIVYAMEVWS